MAAISASRPTMNIKQSLFRSFNLLLNLYEKTKYWIYAEQVFKNTIFWMCNFLLQYVQKVKLFKNKLK